MSAGGLKSLLSALWEQLVRIRTRLLVINLLAVIVPVVGIEWARTYEREILKGLEDDMLHQVQVIRTILEQNVDPQGKPRFELATRALKTTAQRTRMRIRLLDRGGRVFADSHLTGAPEGPEPAVSLWRGETAPPARRHRLSEPATNPGPLVGRVEIKAALKGELGTATRIHQRIQRVFLFLAMPVMVQRRVEGIVYITRSTVPALMSLHRLRLNLIQILAAALCFTALMSLFLATTISRPLTRLTRAAKRITQGDRSVTLHLNRKDEIGQLAGAFETMVEQLDSRARYIADLAANVSHEFKTPLSAIRGAAELLADGAADDPEDRKRFLDNILADVERLNRLVSRILELSRIEASLTHREQFDLGQVIQDVVDRFPPERFSSQIAAELPALTANRAHVESAILALVENALHHSPEEHLVTVEAGVRRGDELFIRVQDQGPGISKANQQKVFDRFFTTEAASGGTGLGLAIVSTVVKAHGGAVTLDSEQGRGSTFEIRLPRG